MVLLYIFLKVTNAENHSMRIFAILIFSMVKFLLKSFAYFSICFVIFLLLRFIFLYIFFIQVFWWIRDLQLFSPFGSLSFHSLKVIFAQQKKK